MNPEFNPHAKGDGEASRGLWQISKIYHPEVSDAMAFNVRSSTQWSLERIREEKPTNGPRTVSAERYTRIVRFKWSRLKWHRLQPVRG